MRLGLTGRVCATTLSGRFSPDRSPCYRSGSSLARLTTRRLLRYVQHTWSQTKVVSSFESFECCLCRRGWMLPMW